MKLRRLFGATFLMLICCSIALAQKYSSPNYSLLDGKIIISGGRTESPNYTLNKVEIGNIVSGKAGSANYSLDASLDKKTVTLSPPAVDSVTSPTNIAVQTLSGTKESGTSILINGSEAIPLDNSTTWDLDYALAEGENILFITCRDQHGEESDAVSVTIILDTIPPVITISAPIDGTLLYDTKITVTGTIDEAAFSEERHLFFGLNRVSISTADEAGNTASKGIEVYRARYPLLLPEL